MSLCFTFAVTLSLLFCSALMAAKPNVVFLLADDLGGSDLSCYGHPYSRTPNIDSLARDGTRFTQFYATGATCCPTRTGLMTAKFPATYPVYPANGSFADRVTITELLKKNGYATGHFGKWHIGPETKSGTYGIDSIGADDDQGAKGKKKKAADDRGRDAHIYEDAIAFIEKHRNAPFFVNVWGHISHNPVNPVENLVKRWSDLQVRDADFPPQMQEKFKAVREAGGDVSDAMRRYLADVESLDDSVGMILKRIDELGLRENTIIIFSTDQGADMTKAGLGGLRFNQMGFNGALRGGKHTHWEGGVRCPWLLRWPGKVPAGRVDSESVLSGVDFLPTLCALSGVQINADDFDGEDASAAWLGRAAHVRTKPLFWKTSSSGGDALIRDGRWKLRLPTRKKDGEIELYDLSQDLSESNNLAEKEHETVRKLAAKLQSWASTLPKEYEKSDTKDE
jgi:arylsulfatase A-like enzyme